MWYVAWCAHRRRRHGPAVLRGGPVPGRGPPHAGVCVCEARRMQVRERGAHRMQVREREREACRMQVFRRLRLRTPRPPCLTLPQLSSASDEEAEGVEGGGERDRGRGRGRMGCHGLWLSRAVTRCHALSRAVTRCHALSRAVMGHRAFEISGRQRQWARGSAGSGSRLRRLYAHKPVWLVCLYGSIAAGSGSRLCLYAFLHRVHCGRQRQSAVRPLWRQSRQAAAISCSRAAKTA
jgi:hypothetical protein